MEEKKPIGAIVSIIVIVLVLVLGAYYSLRQLPPTTEVANEPSGVGLADSTVSALSTQGTSTEIDAIQKDLNATDFSSVGTGLSDIAI
ncbi:MAG: hypothetical protein HZB12_03100 [Candidatus Yonathbacteria bacterium]|nr:hypothetical protein [Candidatus Yonathbacteria bacterium]